MTNMISEQFESKGKDKEKFLYPEAPPRPANAARLK